jgi:hypothetical protein
VRQRFAQPRHEPFQLRPRAVVLRVVPARERPGEHQPPIGRTGEPGRLVGIAPLAAGEFLPQQGIGGVGIGNAQQRFGHAHQRDALAARKAVMAQKRLGAERSRRRGAYACGECPRALGDPRPGRLPGIEAAQPPQGFRLRNAVVARDRCRQRAVHMKSCAKFYASCICTPRMSPIGR